MIGEVGTGEAPAAAEEEEEERSPLQMGDTFGDMVPFGDPMW